MKKKFQITAFTLLLIILIEVFIPANDQKMYAVAFENLVGEDDTYSGNLNPQKIYVSKELVDFIARLNGEPRKEKNKINRRSARAVQKSAEKTGLEIIWVSSKDDLEFDQDTGEIVDGGVLVEFSNIKKEIFGSRVTGSIWVAGLASGGTNYDFIKLFWKWKFHEKSVAWIS